MQRSTRVRWLWEYPPSFPWGEAELFKGRGGVVADVFMVFFLDIVLQRLAEQIIKDVGKAGFNSASWSRTSKPGSGGAVLRRVEPRAVLTWKPGHYFCELLFWRTLALVVMRQLRRLLEEFLVFST